MFILINLRLYKIIDKFNTIIGVTNGVYNGSYLPENPNKLTKFGKKGWQEITSLNDETGLHRTFQKNSSG